MLNSIIMHFHKFRPARMPYAIDADTVVEMRPVFESCDFGRYTLETSVLLDLDRLGRLNKM
jgi:hypothetical protein